MRLIQSFLVLLLFNSQDLQWDIFLSYAREDVAEVVRPLVELLERRGCHVWFDEMQLSLGDSLRRKINDGLAHSRFGVVVISDAFFAKKWPQDEVNGLLARETDGTKVVLPVLHRITSARLASVAPLLADRIAVSTDKGLDSVADEILRVLGGPSADRLAEEGLRLVLLVEDQRILDRWFEVLGRTTAAKTFDVQTYVRDERRTSVLWSFVRLLAKVARIEQAIEVTARIEDDRQINARFEIARWLIEQERFDEAKQYLPAGEFWVWHIAEGLAGSGDLTLVRAMSPSLLTPEALRRILAEAYAKKGDIEESLALAEGIEAPGDRCGVLCRVVTALLRQHKPAKAPRAAEMALECARRVESERNRASYLRDAAQALIEVGDQAAAFKVLQEALQVARSSSPSGGPDIPRGIVRALASAGAEPEELLSLAEEFDDQQLREEALAIAACAFVRHGRIDRVLDLSARIRDRLFLDNPFVDLIAYLVETACSNETLEGVLKSRQYPSFYLHQAALQLGGNGKLDEALNLAGRIRNSDADYAPEDLAVLLAKNRRSTQALDLIAPLEGERRIGALCAIAAALEGAGSQTDAVQMVHDALNLARTIYSREDAGEERGRNADESALPAAVHLLQVAETLIAVSRVPEAIEVLNEALVAAHKCPKGKKETSTCFSRVAVLFARLKATPKAYQLVRFCSQPEDQLTAYTAILDEISHS
jgi:tetratricopeptide (TPR) repeat protein